MTYTYAMLEVSPATFAEVQEKLEAAEYHHAFHRGSNGLVIDMHGIGLSQAAAPMHKERPMHDVKGRLIEIGDVLAGKDAEGEVRIGVVTRVSPSVTLGIPTAVIRIIEHDVTASEFELVAKADGSKPEGAAA